MTSVGCVVDRGIARVTLDEPARRNPLSLATLKRVGTCLAELDTRADVRVVIVEATGPVFSAGHDLREVAAHHDDPDFLDELFGTCAEVMTLVHRLGQPVIAQVQGLATAAGCQLVAACDLAVASQDARFATPGVSIGLFCSTPMVPLSRCIGRKRALQLLLTGEAIDAATALDWGLVNLVVPADALWAATDALARRIALASARTVARGKQAFYEQLEASEGDAYSITVPRMTVDASSNDAVEGIDAFLGKRAARWP